MCIVRLHEAIEKEAELAKVSTYITTTRQLHLSVKNLQLRGNVWALLIVKITYKTCTCMVLVYHLVTCILHVLYSCKTLETQAKKICTSDVLM